MIRGVRSILRAVAGGGESAAAEADFARAQIGGLPMYMRVAVRALACVFEADAFLREGRRFAGLSEAAREARLRAWRRSRFAPFRDFAALCEGLIQFRRFARPEAE